MDRRDPIDAAVGERLGFAMACLQDVLRDAGEPELAAALPWTGEAPAGLPPGVAPERVAQAFSLAFVLLAIVEEQAGAAARAATSHGDAGRRGLFEERLRALRAWGHDREAVAACLARTRIEPVLTAHPTEAKRATVLEHHRRLYRLLAAQPGAAGEPLATRVRAELERLWRTGEIFLSKPDVASELRGVVEYLRHVFPDAVNDLDERLAAACSDADVPHAGARAEGRPQIRFGTWVGGDRDGHPLVTDATTRHALGELRAGALDLLRERLTGLVRGLSLSARLQAPPRELQAFIARMVELLGDAGRTAVARNPDEPWRQAVQLILARLPHPGDEPGPGVAYASAGELHRDLELVRRALDEVGAARLAATDVVPVLRIVETFGFHLAALDVRQNSRFHELAVDGLLAAGGAAEAGFSTWDEDRRRAFLDEELALLRPLTLPRTRLSGEAAAAVGALRVLAAHAEEHGTAGLGALIVSMTRDVSDLLAVVLLAREAGLAFPTPDGLVCPLPVVPLFETIDDLERSPRVLDGLLGHPVIRRSLEWQAAHGGADGLVQQVMVGYSDSNKDGGILASQWSLHRGQAALTETGRRHGVRVRFFHGRGGSLSRGAGPTHRFLSALPPGTLRGDLRMTEQGETVAQKYAHRTGAAYHLELLLAGTVTETLAGGRHAGAAVPAEVMDRLATTSRAAYEELVHADGFLDFFGSATPIDAIEASRHGSRPARRTGRRTLADLRAIPWVFAWSQARFHLTGWYGVGSALTALAAEDPDGYEAVRRAALRWPPLRYLVGNVAVGLLTVDDEVWPRYASLVADADLRDRLLARIAAERDRTRERIEDLYGGRLDDRRPTIAHLLDLRRAPLRVLHEQQVELLRTWRERRAVEGEAAAEEDLVRVLVTVNAIAGGLRATG